MRRAFRPLGFAFLLAASPSAARTIAETRAMVVEEALRYLNVPYLWGSGHPDTGLDCSAFVQLAYRGAGLPLPRGTRSQFASTSSLAPQEVLPGDLVFFSIGWPGSGSVDHVGIYVGRGYFVHASTRNGVWIEPLAKPYYLERLVGIRKHPGF